MSDWLDIAKDWKDQIAVKHGKAAWEQLSGRHKTAVIDALTDLAKLRVQELVGADIAVEVGFVNATLRNLEVEAGIVLARTLIDVLVDSLKFAGSALTGILGGIKF